MYYVYILQSRVDKSFYTGMTQSLKKRLQDHNWRQAKYTASKAPFDLVWYCAFRDKQKALVFETYLKSGSGFALARKRFV